MEHSSFSLKVKGGVDDAGRFSGLAACFNNVDEGGDRILPGAFSKTLSTGKSWPLLWQHDPGQPIGSFKAVETSAGLQVEGQLLLSIPAAANARELLKANVLRGMSIGYTTEKADYDDQGVRELKELRLFEASIVTFAMNPLAEVQSIKTLSDDDRSKHLAAINVHRKAIDRHQRAMREHLKAMFDVGDDDPADDPEPLDDGDEYGEMSMIVSELKALAEQANELANA